MPPKRPFPPPPVSKAPACVCDPDPQWLWSQEIREALSEEPLDGEWGVYLGCYERVELWFGPDGKCTMSVASYKEAEARPKLHELLPLCALLIAINRAGLALGGV